MRVIDFRSDFVAPPTAAMVEAMVAAAAEQPSFGLTDDPTVNRLEARAAPMLGKEAALFVPTCTMANQIAINLHCRPGEAVLAEAASHIFLGESGSMAALSGAMAVPVPGVRGAMDLERLAALIRGREVQRSRTALIVLENSHANGGGVVMPLAYHEAAGRIARDRGVPVHLDGARLFNAAIRLGVPAAALAASADSVSISLNKGLGAPVGALLLGSRDFIARAVHVRQLFGGGWRPVNILAAAALMALDTMVDRLADDHAHARLLAEGLAACPGIAVAAPLVDTNIVFATVEGITEDAFLAGLRQHGILALRASGGPAGTIRFVTHHGIGRADIEAALAVARSLARADRPRR